MSWLSLPAGFRQSARRLLPDAGLLLLALLLGGLAWLAAAAVRAEPNAEVLVFDQARMLPVAAGAGADWRAARPVQLPDDWAVTRPTQRGVVTYRLSLPPPPATTGGQPVSRLYGLYVERACSVMAAQLNGQTVHEGGRFDEPVSRQCHRPQLVALPAALFKPGENLLDLQVRGYPLAEVSSRQRAGGLSVVEFGPYDLMAAHHARRLVFAIRLPEVLSGALVLMGSFMFVMGWFNRQQSYLAYFGALMVGWSLLLARLWAADLPVANAVTEAALAALMAFITLAAVQFLMRYAKHRLRWLDIALPLQCVLMPLSLVALGPSRLYLGAGLWYVLLTGQVLAAAAFYLTQARRQRSRQLWPMGTLLSVVALALLVEVIAMGWGQQGRWLHVAQLLPALGFLALGLRLVQQYGRAFQNAEQNRADLEVRIREATAQIERNFAQLAELKVEQVTDRERKRIAADLHDDLGAKLLTIVHTSDDQRISTLAREALEEMRLSRARPDRQAGETGRRAGRLARRGGGSRLSRRRAGRMAGAGRRGTAADAGGARLRADHPHPARGGQQHHQAQRCLALQRALRIDAGDFQLVIQDNGKGIPTELDGRLDKGHGMASMKGRAKQLQGQCLVESGPGYGTVIRLTLPIERAQRPQHLSGC
jgi:two-component system, NarL family, sensor histidine kinase UhpB